MHHEISCDRPVPVDRYHEWINVVSVSFQIMKKTLIKVPKRRLFVPWLIVLVRFRMAYLPLTSFETMVWDTVKPQYLPRAILQFWYTGMVPDLTTSAPHPGRGQATIVDKNKQSRPRLCDALGPDFVPERKPS